MDKTMTTQPLFICAWCVKGVKVGTHGICPKCLDKQLEAIAALDPTSEEQQDAHTR